MLPIVTILGSSLGMILSGAVLVETVFGYPGLGRLMIQVITARDYPVLMGLFLLISISVVVVNFFTDLTYTFLDPRIKYTK
jgi:peptide/nickel transport system permease protein